MQAADNRLRDNLARHLRPASDKACEEQMRISLRTTREQVRCGGSRELPQQVPCRGLTVRYGGQVSTEKRDQTRGKSSGGDAPFQLSRQGRRQRRSATKERQTEREAAQSEERRRGSESVFTCVIRSRTYSVWRGLVGWPCLPSSARPAERSERRGEEGKDK